MQSVLEKLAALPLTEREAILNQLSQSECEALLHDWRGFHARPEQCAPDGDWDIWLILSGRGWGKTRTGAEWIREKALASPIRIALIGETAADARDVMVEGESGILRCHPENERPVYEPSKRRLTWPNGSVATLFNATEPDQLRGPQANVAWCDELCLIAGTLVEGEFGQVAIETIKRGDRVWTRKGLRKVARAWKTSDSADVWRLTSRSGKSITGTANHPVWTEETGFKPLRIMRNGDTLLAWKSSEQSGAVSAGIFTGITSETGRVNSCIERSTKPLLGRFLKALMSITSMVTRPTMSFQTSPLSVAVSTCGSMGREVFSFGTQAREARTQARTSGESASPWQLPVIPAGLSSSQSECARNIAGQIAGQRRSGPQIPDTILDAVESVERLPEKAAVYNIEVEGEPEYFANGILTHNCKWRYARETWDQLQFGMRLGTHPQIMVTTTPRPIELLKGIVSGAEGKVTITRGRTMDNRNNLAGTFLEKIENRYGGTRLGRQELEGEILGDIPNALWTLANIDASRVREAPPTMKRIYVAVDPAVSNTEQSDEHGIVVVGQSPDGKEGYVLEDASMKGSPMEWAKRALSVHDRWQADGIAVEVNQGGDMVAQTIRSVRSGVKIVEVRASRGKHVRAEPIAALYEQGRIHHVGSFVELETQMTQMTTFGYEGDGSPDRTDALVWGLSVLFPSMVREERAKPRAAPPPVTMPMARR